MRRLLILLACLAALLLPATAAQAATSVSLDSRADWHATHIDVGGTLACEQAGSTVTVTVTQGNMTGTSGRAGGLDCDGASHSFGTTVAGVFQVGSAQATAVLRSPSGQELARASRTISIVV